MVDVAVTAQLQQWSGFEKSTVRPERSDSSASTPDLYDPETLRIDTSVVDHSKDLESTESLIQERYLSSEEDLSPMEPDFDEDMSDFEEAEIVEAKQMSIASPTTTGPKPCDLAVVVSYVSAGRPKVVHLPSITSPIREKTERSASLAALPSFAKAQFAQKSSRYSLALKPSTPVNSRPLSIGRPPFSQETSSLGVSESSSSIDDPSKSTSSLSTTSSFQRPASAKTTSHWSTNSQKSIPRASVAPSLLPFPPLTPQSPDAHSFLSSDPFASDSTSAASPIIKNAPHKRLRSISQKLSLAKIAVNTANKRFTRSGTMSGTMPPTPATPYSPVAPMTAPPSTFTSPGARSRRNSKMMPRGANERETVFELPSPPPEKDEIKPRRKLVARGADERAPPIELPPFPDDDGADPSLQMKSRRIRKRKSLMDFDRFKELM